MTGTIPVFKLHGSLNWTLNGQFIVAFQDMRPAFRHGGTAAIIPPVPEKPGPTAEPPPLPVILTSSAGSQNLNDRGYIIPGREAKANVLTFIAYDEGQIVGTVGLGVDSDKGRLSADTLYRLEIDELRAKGCRVCEFTRLAVDSTAASKPILAGLFQTAYLYAAVIKGYTHAVIEVNPRHVIFYGRSLKFEPLGPERVNERVHAPAVLLCASFESIAHELKKYAGKTPPPGTKRTLFHYGFPPAEEVGVLMRLRALVATR